MVTIDVDYMGDKEDAKYESKMFGIKIVVNDNYDQADVSGTKVILIPQSPPISFASSFEPIKSISVSNIFISIIKLLKDIVSHTSY